jgi:subtilisin family serine protease
MMKLLALFALVACATATAPFFAREGAEVIEGQYMVIFKNEASAADRQSHYDSLKFLEGEDFLFKYEFDGFTGYSAKMGKETLASVLAMDDTVAYVEVDQAMHALACQTQSNLPSGLWGLGRISQRSLPNQGMYEYNSARGASVTSYIIDTGIMCTHNDFSSRCTYGFDATGEGNGDGNGHGTHVAGTVGGTTYGVSKNTRLVAVKVLNRQGSGSTSGVTAGINYVANAHGGGAKSVANLSLGGGFSQALNDATNAAVANGVHMVVASGNSNANACNFSPASAANAISVNSMTNTDARSSFSNFGTCTHIFAPGSNILSSWIGSNTATSTISGTSMAAPHVAGVVAEMIEVPGAPQSPSAVRAELQKDATQNVISSPGTGSPNMLLFIACTD